MKKKGFTLIELLIVITIIGILAVAFLPSVLNAPAKSRDAQRMADLQKLQKVLIASYLVNGSSGIPSSDGCVTSANFGTYIADMGGLLPEDPKTEDKTYGTGKACTGANQGAYWFELDPGSYDFGLYSLTEVDDDANTRCANALSGTLDTSGTDSFCYAVLTKQ